MIGTMLAAAPLIVGSLVMSTTWQQDVSYDWSVQVAQKPDYTVVAESPARKIAARVDARVEVRREARPANRFAAHGEVCLSNLGSAATQALKIEAEAQYCVHGRRGDIELASSSCWVDIPESKVEVAAHELPALDSGCFSFEMPLGELRSTDHAVFRARLMVTGTNVSRAVELTEPLTFTNPVVTREVDATARLSYALSMPAGFAPYPAETTVLGGSYSRAFQAPLVNMSLPCERMGIIEGAASLVASDTGAEKKSMAFTTVTTELCRAITAR